MSDLEQVDIISTSEDDVKTSVLSKCAYCDCQKDGVLVFYCEKCSRWIHASKLKGLCSVCGTYELVIIWHAYQVVYILVHHLLFWGTTTLTSNVCLALRMEKKLLRE